MLRSIALACAVGASISFPASPGFAEDATPPHPGPWPIEHGHNLQPRRDQLRAMNVRDLTPEQAREVERLYEQLEASSTKILEPHRASR